MTFLKNTAVAFTLGATGFGGAASADVVHLDDVIINGSLCVGQDCVNGEAFGFDTIRLKENNVRIKFDDTSVSGSFPNRDWQLTANDSANGGANKFSIDDITGGRTPFTIVGNAPNNALFVDAAGRLGLGTATPSVEIHSKNGDSPTLRLEQDGSSGFGVQTWDVAGNEANFFIRDVSNGSTLPFRIQPGAPSSAIYIASTGNIGLGTTSPDADLHISDSSGTPAVRFEDTASNVEWEAGLASNDTFKVSAVGATGVQFRFTREGGLVLQPQTTAPVVSLGDGMVYYDNSGALCARISNAWVVIGGAGSCS